MNLIAELVEQRKPYEVALGAFDLAADALDLPSHIRSVIKSPERVVQLRVPIRKSNGQVGRYDGWTVQHNTSRGPAKGGILYHPSVTLDDVQALAMGMTWKWAMLNIPFGGGKAGVIVDPDSWQNDFAGLTCHALDVVPVSSQGWDTHLKAEVAGNPIRMSASKAWREAAGLGVFCTIKAACEHLQMHIREARVVVHGFGNTGSVTTQLLAGAQAMIVGASDTRGAIFNAAGLDIPKLILHKERYASVVGFSGAEPITDYEMLALDSDILIVAAAKHVIHGQNAPAIQARIIAEVADGSVTPKGDGILDGMERFVIPASLCNAGGLIAAYLQGAQPEKNLSWDEHEMHSRLEHAVYCSFHEVLRMSQESKVNMRTAATMLGIRRVAESMKLGRMHA